MIPFLLILAAASPLQTGDLVFHTSHSSQSGAIMAATGSKYSHVGMVQIKGGKAYVIEAAKTVRVVPFADFVRRGRGKKYVVARDTRLSDKQRLALFAEAEKYLGRRYDIYFSTTNREIYCSELIDLAYKGIGERLGKWEKVGPLLSNKLAARLVSARWRKHPACGRSDTKAACLKKIGEEELISPQGLWDGSLRIVQNTY